MTLCIAAACKYEDTPSIVLVTDTRREKGLAGPMFSELKIGSDDAEKMRVMGRGFAALVSGTPTKADELLAKCEAAVYQLEDTKPNSDADIVITAFLRVYARVHGKGNVN